MVTSLIAACPRLGDAPVPTRFGVESQLRDAAILLLIGLLLVLTMQVLRLTRSHRDDGHQR
jgi:hypothetical protein